MKEVVVRLCVAREKGERRKEKRGPVWDVLERGGSGLGKKRKEGKKEKKSKGTCVEEKKRGKKRRKYGWKEKKKEIKIEKCYHNIFTILSQ